MIDRRPMQDVFAPPPAVRRQQWLARIDTALRESGLDAAASLALQALSDGVEDAVILNLAAAGRYAESSFDEALQLLARANTLAPGDPNVLNSMGICQFALGQAGDALRSYEAALRHDPNMAAAYYNRGTALEQLDDVKAARACYEQAVALDGNYVDALASLSWLDAVAGDAVASRSNAERALALSPSHALARTSLASANLQQGNLAEAGTILGALIRDPTLTRINRAIVAGLIGDLKDAQGQAGDAFAAYQACNAEIRAMNAARFEAPGSETALARARRLTAWFASSDVAAWREAPPVAAEDGRPREHIFLVGFPRSGTTLLENVLAAHADVVALEEKDCLAAADQAFLTSDEGLERLATIDDEEAEHRRELYWSSVRNFGVEPSAKVFIDKLPLASVQLPVIAKLFPQARVLFALRDPRDVVLSCFRRRFALNPAMYELLTLSGAAAYYDAVMALSERYRELLPLSQITVRYESLVDDFEGTSRATCAFLGLQWDSAMFDFAEKARTRGIATPSAAQVSRGLNREGQGVWKRYREQMAPVLPILEPWVERFGYDTS